MTEEKAKEVIVSAEKDLRYYERALVLQSEKIERQSLELARMNRVYKRDVGATSFSEAFSFLIKIIIKNIKK